MATISIEHIRGNEFNVDIGPLHDQKNVVIDLSTAVDIIFAIKRGEKDLDADALVIASINDSPSSGVTKNNVTSIITVVLSSDDMDLVPVGVWFIALQVEYPEGRRIEAKLMKNRKQVKTITVLQDTIIGGEPII